jgi:hypothetical protein
VPSRVAKCSPLELDTTVIVCEIQRTDHLDGPPRRARGYRNQEANTKEYMPAQIGAVRSASVTSANST